MCDEAVLQIVVNTLTDTDQSNLDCSKMRRYMSIAMRYMSIAVKSQ